MAGVCAVLPVPLSKSGVPEMKVPLSMHMLRCFKMMLIFSPK